MKETTQGEKTWYGVLEVDQNASDEQIKAAYKKLALQYHPDRNPNDKVAEENFKKVDAAYKASKDRSSKSEPGAHAPSTGLDEQDKADVEKVLRSIITAINPKKKAIPLDFRPDAVHIGEYFTLSQVLTCDEARTFILTLEYLIDKVIKPAAASSALLLGNEKHNHIEELWNQLKNAETGESAIYNDPVLKSFYVKNDLFKFYLPVFMQNAEVIKEAINEVQTAVLWSNGLKPYTKAYKKNNQATYCTVLTQCKKGEGLYLNIKTNSKDLSWLYKILLEKGIDKESVSLVRTDPYKELNIPYSVFSKSLVFELQARIEERNEKEVQNLLKKMPEKLGSETLNKLFDEAIDNCKAVDLEIVEALTKRFKDSMDQGFKEELFINAVMCSSPAVVNYFYSEFKPTIAYRSQRLGTVWHSFARRFCQVCGDITSEMDSKGTPLGIITLDTIQQHRKAELEELKEIRKLIQPMLKACEEIKDKKNRIPDYYCKEFKTTYIEFQQSGQQEPIDSLCFAIANSNVKVVPELLSKIPKNLDPKILKNILYQAIKKPEEQIKANLEIVKALIGHFKDSMDQGLKEELCIDATEISSDLVSDYLNSEFKKTSETRIEESSIAQQQATHTEATEQNKTRLECLLKGVAIGAFAGGVVLLGLYATTSCPGGIVPAAAIVAGFVIAGIVIASLATPTPNIPS